MVLEKLSGTLKKVTDKIANAVFLDKKLVDSIVRDLQRALIEADVNVPLVLEITKKLKQAALDERISGIAKKEHMIKLLHDELINILGEKKEIKLKKKNTFLFVGLYGSGKTTTISKIAQYYKKRGSSVCAVGLDVHRPAASEQLKQLAEKVGIQAFVDSEEIENPEIIEKQTSRIQRISKGSGVSTSDIRMLIKQYKMMKEMVSNQDKLASGDLDQKTIMKLAKKFGKKMKF